MADAKPLANPAVAQALLTFATMLERDYGVPKEDALKGLAIAYDVNTCADTNTGNPKGTSAHG